MSPMYHYDTWDSLFLVLSKKKTITTQTTIQLSYFSFNSLHRCKFNTLYFVCFL